MKAFGKIKFRDRIALSFGGLVILVAINALVGIYTAYSISDQITIQKDVARIVDEIVRMRDATEQYKRTGSRKAALLTFTTLVQVKQEIERTGTQNAHVAALRSQLDDFWLSFQKFVIETDQKSALESRTMQLGRSMVNEINDARTRRTLIHDHETFDTLVGEILNLQWQGQELRFRSRNAPPELLENIRTALSKLREPMRLQAQSTEAQRQLYRILQDAVDYMNSFDDYQRFQVLNEQSEQDLSRISEQLQATAWRFSDEATQAIQRQIPSSIALMLAVFVITLIGAMILSRTLSREILKPILGLLKTTQAITHGRLDERAEISVDDEIGELGRSFNQMTDTLRSLQDDLESRVTDRTLQLAEANQALENEIVVRKNAEATIAERERHLRTIIDLVPQFIFAKNSAGQFTLANRAVAEHYGTTPENLIGKTDRDFNPDEAQVTHFIACDQKVILTRRELYISEEPNTDATGETRYFETTKIPYFGETGTEIPSVLGVSVDITERKSHQRQLEHIAHYDALTDLPNRVLLADRLKQTMAQTLRHNNLLAVVYLDLDGFKNINDKHGHNIGDRLLSSLAVRLKQALREGDTLARIGGDEFVAVLLDLHDHTDSAPVLERLLETAAEAVHLGGHLLQVSASLGVTYFPQSDDVDADQLLRQADQAMYLAKQAGKNRYHIFDAEQDRSVRGHHESLERIRQALENEEFVLFYQPKVNMRSGQVIGAEALIRWEHPERGIVPPGAFLPLIENHSLSIDIGEWVLDNALEQIETWREKGLRLPVSINIDPIYFGQNNFVERLRQKLAHYPEVQPGDLELEVLETSALEDIGQLSEIMAACHEIGVGFALDDFGTGYSSLTYLKRLPAGLLKIDRSFVHEMLDDPEDLAILEGVLGLATAFRRQVIAEGVETLAHGELLLQIGCEWGQGYAIAKPMPAVEIETWIQQWRPASSWAQCPQARRDDIPVLFAMVENRAWLKALHDFMYDETALTFPMEKKLGRLEQWLGNPGSATHSGNPDIDGIETSRQNLLQLCSALSEFKIRQETGQMHACFNEIEIIHEDLMSQLKRFIARSDIPKQA